MVREAILRMRPYIPPLEGRGDLLRLDFNENTLGAPPRALAALRSAAEGAGVPSYPEYGSTAAMAEYFGVDPGQMVLTNGTDEALQLLIQSVTPPGAPVVIPTPSYAMARFYAELAGASIRETPYDLPDLGFPLAQVIEAARSAAVTYLANPNNPTGTLLDEREIRQILEATRGLVIVDEAYFEFARCTMAPLMQEFPHLVITRTFSKAFGLAGLRIGAILAAPDLAANLRKARSPYSVNALAVAGALGALQDLDWVEAYAAESRESVARLRSGLARLGHRAFPSAGNFVLFEAGDQAPRRVAALRERGILVRDRGHDIAGSVRVTAGTRAQTEQFLQAWEETK